MAQLRETAREGGPHITTADDRNLHGYQFAGTDLSILPSSSPQPSVRGPHPRRGRCSVGSDGRRQRPLGLDTS
jgi:hypothetical protein